MATTKKMTFAEAQDIINVCMFNGGEVPEGVNMAEVWKIMESTPDSGFETLNAEYWKPEIGTHNVFYDGLTSANFKEGPTACAKLRTKDGKHYIFAGKVFIDSVSELQPPCLIRIENKGLQKIAGTNRSYYDVTVMAFPGTKRISRTVVNDAQGVPDGLPFE